MTNQTRLTAERKVLTEKTPLEESEHKDRPVIGQLKVEASGRHREGRLSAAEAVVRERFRETAGAYSFIEEIFVEMGTRGHWAGWARGVRFDEHAEQAAAQAKHLEREEQLVKEHSRLLAERDALREKVMSIAKRVINGGDVDDADWRTVLEWQKKQPTQYPATRDRVIRIAQVDARYPNPWGYVRAELGDLEARTVGGRSIKQRSSEPVHEWLLRVVKETEPKIGEVVKEMLDTIAQAKAVRAAEEESRHASRELAATVQRLAHGRAQAEGALFDVDSFDVLVARTQRDAVEWVQEHPAHRGQLAPLMVGDVTRDGRIVRSIRFTEEAYRAPGARAAFGTLDRSARTSARRFMEAPLADPSLIVEQESAEDGA